MLRSKHGLWSVYSPTPLEWFDPYDISSIQPQEYPGDYDLTVSGPYSENSYSPQQYTPVAYSRVCVRTPTVASVEFQTINSAITEDNPVSLGGGQRIFPDKQTPTDNVNRRIVRVSAQLAPAIDGQPVYDPNVRVYFRNYDVDDPSIDPIIDPDGNVGNDNRDNVNGSTAGELSRCAGYENGICYGTTDSNGVATVDFTVTMQPGDNFVLAASTDRSYLAGVTENGTGLRDSGGNEISMSSARARRTQMLSVWRRLHIEVDSMGPADGNFVLGRTAVSPFPIKIKPNQTRELTLNPSPADPLEVNRFENGRLAIGSDSLTVISNTTNTVTVINNGSDTVSVLNNVPFQLYDDDDFNDNDGNLVDGDDRENVPMPPTSLLTQNSDDPAVNLLAPAYIWPVYDIGDNNDNTQFTVNVAANSGQAIRDLFDFDNLATEASPEFWTAYLLGAYQYTVEFDNDPESELLYAGISDDQNGQGSVVFWEPHGAKECLSTPAACSVPGSAAHEIGHLLNADDGDGEIMDSVSLIFSPTSLNKIRSVPHP